MENPNDVGAEKLLAGVRSLASGEALSVGRDAPSGMDEEFMLGEVVQVIRHRGLIGKCPANAATAPAAC